MDLVAWLGGVVALIVLFIILLNTFLCAKARSIRRNGTPVPGPNPLFTQYSLITDLHNLQIQLNQQYGKVAATTVLTKPALFVSDPLYIKQIMMDRWEEFGRIDFDALATIAPLIDESLFVFTGEKWKELRNKLKQGFKFTTLKFMVKDIVAGAAELTAAWLSEIEKSKIKQPVEIEISSWLGRMTTEVIGLTGFGLKFNSFDTSNPGLFPHINRIMKESTNFFAYIPYFHLLPTPGNRSIKRAVKEVATATQQVIELRLKEDNPPQDLLQVMLSHEQEPKMSSQGVLSNAMGFLVAGYETTSLALTWILYELSKNQEIQDRVREEVKSVLDGRDSPTWEDISHFKYMNFVIKEGLRLYPPAWANGRTAPEDMYLDDIFLPKGTAIVISVLALHRSTEIWGPDALRFIPERWDSESEHFMEAPRGAYIPFNIGPRDCIGTRFANTEMKLSLAYLLCRFKFLPSEKSTNVSFEMSETLKPKNGLYVNIQSLS